MQGLPITAQGFPITTDEQVLIAWQFKSIRIVIILIFALAAYWIFRALARRLAGKIPQKRLATLLSLVYSIITIFVFGIAGLIILRELNIDITPILASAGIVGLAIGFGAQTLVRDLITGVFILTEDQIRIGDVVKIGETQGTVEKIGLQTLTLRDMAGSLHLIPNSQIGKIVNLTRDFAYVDLQIGVSAKHPVDEVLAIVAGVSKQVQKEKAEEIVADPEVLGVEEISGGKLVIRVRLKTKPKKQFALERRLLYLLKKAFEEKKFEFA